MRTFQSIRDFDSPDLQRRITISSLLAIGFAIGMATIGLVMRNNALNATLLYVDELSGIRAQIPVDWLLSEGQDDTVFRAENPGGRPFKTLIQVSVETVGEDATPRNIVDLLKLQGPAKLSGYRALSEEDITLGEDEAVRITYNYVDQELNPFLDAIPITIRGEDVVVLRGNQAIIITYRDADSTFDDNRFYFLNFIRSIEY